MWSNCTIARKIGDDENGYEASEGMRDSVRQSSGGQVRWEHGQHRFRRRALLPSPSCARLERIGQTHLRQFEILTSCFTSTFPAGKATWHYITLSDCILELGADPLLILRRDDRCRASSAAGRGRESPQSVAKVCGPVRKCSDAQHVTPTESCL